MAVISLTIPDAQLARVVNAVASQYGYQATIPDPAHPGTTIANPVTKAAFAKQVLASFLVQVVAASEANAAADSARAAAVAAATSAVTIT